MTATTNGGNFPHLYARKKQALGIQYEAKEFLYAHDGPWPQMSFDYPYGQAPEVLNIPKEEMEDWGRTIGKYYTENALGTASDPSPFGVAGAEFAKDNFFQNGLSGYASIEDEEFVELICEGLYSKFLSKLDPQDEELFDLANIFSDHSDEYEYFKSDYRCMMVVQKTWPNEYAAPTIAVVRRRKGEKRYADQGAYKLVAVALARQTEKDGPYEFTKDLVFNHEAHGESSAWWLAKYFVLQGAIHRINLIDHVKVHFPPDAINAVTKTILPKWHLIHQLLVPHFWLTLPVNNSVLEGQRSLINRDTWYPWSPFVAKGGEIRKLFPFAWAGSKYYWDEHNSSYPEYRYSLEIDSMPDPEDPGAATPTFIGMDCSRYGAYLKSYYEPILEFARGVVALLPDPPADTAGHDDISWLELQHWAYQISQLVPGFPDEHAICDKETLAKVCAMVIWNGAVVHSSDHTTLHKMMNEKPVPFVLRVKPPQSVHEEIEEELKDVFGDKGQKFLEKIFHGIVEEMEKKGGLEGLLAKVADGLGHKLGKLRLRKGKIPLCWPTDLLYARMADLLFYRPHNSSLLYDCEYAFQNLEETAEEKAWRAAGRPVLDAAQKEQLIGIRKTFQGRLDAVNALYYREDGTAIEPAPPADEHSDTDDAMRHLNRFAFPKLRPGTNETKDAATEEMVRREICLGAGVQY